MSIAFSSAQVRASIVRGTTTLALAFCIVSTASVSFAHAESPARFMQRVANELISATRSGSTAAIAKVITNYADVYSIGLSALGSYAPRLKRSDRSAYHRGLTLFVARYAAKESPKYPVSKAVMTGTSKGGRNVFYVDSRVYLRGGQTYDVRWVIFKRGSRYKVRDAEVIGLRASSFLDTLFQNYIGENGGNPRALVAALNR